METGLSGDDHDKEKPDNISLHPINEGLFEVLWPLSFLKKKKKQTQRGSAASREAPERHLVVHRSSFTGGQLGDSEEDATSEYTSVSGEGQKNCFYHIWEHFNVV